MLNRLRVGVPLAVLVLGAMLFAGTEANRPATVDSNRPRRFTADERLSATMPNHPVGLAQPIHITLYLTDANVDSISVFQGNEKRSNFANKSSGLAIGGGEAKIVQDNGLTKVIEITPLQVGVLNIDFLIFFADGGRAHKSYQMNVVPSSNGLKQFNLLRGHSLALVLEDNDEDSRTWLSPEVYYSHLDYPIYLTDFKQIKFTVQQSDGYPVIRLDSNGMVHALRPGKATIIADFDGVQDSVAVTVYTKENAPSGYRKVLRPVVPPQLRARRR